MDKIETISGNLLDFPPYCQTDPNRDTGINNIAHSCNCRMIMGGGIAKQIKNRYPQAYEADVKFICDEYDEEGQFKYALGNYSKAVIEIKFLPNNKATIYNLYTQASIGGDSRQVNYEKFWQALKNMHGISCGLAGGNWGIIKAMIEDIFLDSLIKTYIVRFDLA